MLLLELLLYGYNLSYSQALSEIIPSHVSPPPPISCLIYVYFISYSNVYFTWILKMLY